MIGDVVRQRAANEADRNGALRKIVDGTRDARHLLRIRHLELREGERRREYGEDAEEQTFHNRFPQFLQNFASASLPVEHDAHTRSAIGGPERLALRLSERGPFRVASFASLNRFSRSRSICCRYPTTESS